VGLTKKVNEWFAKLEKQYTDKQDQLQKDLPILIRNAVDEIKGEVIRDEVRKAVQENIKELRGADTKGRT